MGNNGRRRSRRGWRRNRLWPGWRGLGCLAGVRRSGIQRFFDSQARMPSASRYATTAAPIAIRMYLMLFSLTSDTHKTDPASPLAIYLCGAAPAVCGARKKCRQRKD